MKKFFLVPILHISFQNVSIKWKLTAIITIALALILTLFSISVYTVLSRTVYDSQKQVLHSKASAIAEFYADLLENPAAVDQFDAASEQDTWKQSFLGEGQVIELWSPENNRIDCLSRGDIQIQGFDQMLKEHSVLATADGSSKQSPPTEFETMHDQTLELNGIRMIIVDLPVYDKKQLVGRLVVGQSLAEWDHYLNFLKWLLLLGSSCAISLTAVSGYFFARSALKPVCDIIAIVRTITIKELSRRVPVVPTRDEIELLAITCNEMLGRMEQSFLKQNQFVTDASHELRTPLAAIEGYANMLKRWGKNHEEVREKAIHVIIKESRRLRNLTNDLLQLARIQSGSIISAAQTDVATVLLETVDQFRLLQNVEHSVMPSLLTQIKDREVIADIAEDHLKQVLLILIDNACKHTSLDGEIHISVCLGQKVLDGDHLMRSGSTHPRVKIRVKDNGEGIPPEDVPYVFDRFYRVDKARSRRTGGTGLGLPIAKAIIESYGGKIELESAIGIGTAVTVYIPLSSNTSKS